MDAGLRAVLASAVPFALRLARPFRGLRTREGMLLCGPVGWGEFAPFDDYSDEAAARWLQAALETSFDGASLPAPVRSDVTSNAIIAALDAGECAEQARSALVDLGCSTIKMQVGGAGIDEDVVRVSSVRDVLDQGLGAGKGDIRLDAKARWSAKEAAACLQELADFGIEYVEQPCGSLAELRELRSLIDLPIAVDETIRQAADLAALSRRDLVDSADILILKPAPLGGVAATVELAQRLGMPVVVSGSLDSSIGLASVARAAAAVPTLAGACGLGTGVLLADDLVAQTTLPVRGSVHLESLAPDPEALERARVRVGDERAAWWRARLVRAWESCDPRVRERVVA